MKTSEVLNRLDLRRIPEEVLKDAFLKLERRWVAADLPRSEILDALAHSYGFIADLVDDAHSQVGLPVPYLVSPRADGSYGPFPGSTAYLQGRLPCMVAPQSHRESWVELKTGHCVEFRTKPYKLSARKTRKIKDRYDLSIIAPEQETLATLDDWVWHLWGIARHMFERDGHHIYIAFLLHNLELLGIRRIETESHGDLFVVYRNLANEVARRGATDVIVIGEVWTAPFDPKHRFRRAELSPQRGEGLELSAVSADGNQLSLFAPITRIDGSTVLGETEGTRKGVHRSLAAVVDVWRHR